MGSRNEIRAEKEWEDMNYTYILKCSDETLYTGWTNDLEKRINAHNAGKGAKYTKNRRPVELAYYEEFATKEEAMSREYAIKQLTRRKKEELIKKGHPGIQFGTEHFAKMLRPKLIYKHTLRYSGRGFRPLRTSGRFHGFRSIYVGY